MLAQNPFMARDRITQRHSSSDIIRQQAPDRRPSERSSSPFKFLHARKSQELPSAVDASKTQKRWTVDYLTELRKPSNTRPLGARPPPGRAAAASLDLPSRFSSTLVRDSLEQQHTRQGATQKRRSISPFKMDQTTLTDRTRHAGRPLARVPDVSVVEDIARANADLDNVKVEIDGKQCPMPYYERGQRWMERQEAMSLRAAMDYMDVQEEKKIYDAAQEQAAELVWKHKFSETAYENPDFLRHTRDHLQKGSHARSQSIGPFESLYITKGGVKPGTRVPSDGSNSNQSKSSSRSNGSRVVSTSSKESGDSKSSSASRRYGSLSFKNPAAKLFGSRRSSRKSRKSSDGKQTSLFSNPQDKIYEEPQVPTAQTAESGHDAHGRILSPKSRNISGSHRSNMNSANRPVKVAAVTDNKVSSVEIHKNQPSQSRNGGYLRNAPVPHDPAQMQEADSVPKKDGKEVRGDDIRAATSMRLKDKSDTLPQPVYVSDLPGRPIVSFDSQYQATKEDGHPPRRDAQLTGARPLRSRFVRPGSNSQTVQAPPQNVYEPNRGSSTDLSVTTTPDVPTISLPGDEEVQQSIPAVPSINLPDTNELPTVIVPSIEVTPTPRATNTNEHSSHSDLPHQQSRRHWSPAPAKSSGAQCNTCGQHITGRTLSAAGERFHPGCFNCYGCGTNLEHVAFYPEPESARSERLSLMPDAQLTGTFDTRFFCHLDFHENFSPRCKSCKTPIEGEVIVACGSHWHQGHFFCAQCGDPFDGEKPFIEKDGWAWCVGCYKGRYSGKCKGCRKAVIDDGVMALGVEWHADCFTCTECGSPFDDGRFFTRSDEQGPVCVRCEEIRLKA